jgi:hypothetical protein
MPVVLSGYSGVNAGGSLWVLQCQHRWFSLGTPEYPERTTGIDTDVLGENHRHSERHCMANHFIRLNIYNCNFLIIQYYIAIKVVPFTFSLIIAKIYA